MAYKLIQSRSPFYVQYASSEPVVTCAVTIWTGTISSKPASASYNLSKEPDGASATFEIGLLIRGFISQLSTTAGAVWVNVVTGDGVGTDVENTYVATEGYTLFDEGLQHEGTAKTNIGYALPEWGTRTYRMLLPENTAGGAPSLVYTGTNAGTDTSASQNVVQSIGSATSSISKSENSQAYIVYIDRFRCSKHAVAKLTYINRLGGLSDFYFTAKTSEALMSSSDSFNRSLTDLSNLSANNGMHAHRKRILSSKQMFTLNTDFMDEYYTKQIEELFFSEFVWLSYGSLTGIPVNLDNGSLDKKTHLNDKLIQYTFNVTTAANYLNDVR